jgi:hypothetical protein
MRRIPMIAATVVTLMAFTAGSVLAAPVTDNSQTDHSWNNLGVSSDYHLAQTFTAHHTGTLVKADLWVSPQAGANGTKARPNASGLITVEIRSTSANLPTASVLATETPTLSDGLNTVTFTTPAGVVAGTKYAMVITPAGGAGWMGTCTDALAGGEALVYDGAWKTIPAYAAGIPGWDPAVVCARDFAFVTYVQPGTATPPPTTTSGREDRPSPTPPASPALLFAGLAAAGAFVAIRRFAPTRS